MKTKLNINYQNLLALVKQLPARELEQFKADVASIQPNSLSVPGESVSIDDLMENLQLSEQQAKAGQIYTSTEVKQQIESWNTK